MPDIQPEHIEIPAQKKRIIFSILLIIILGFAVYGNSLNNAFVWDDEALVEDNKYIKNWSHIPKAFTQDIGAGFEREWNFYRPLQMITYTADYSLWKSNPTGYHLTNILLHIAVALSIFWLINIIFKENLLALLTALFYVAHPIHTEAVTYISGRADSLALLFMLLCFILYIKSLPTKKGGHYFLMLLSYVCALLSRENSLILPALLLFYTISFNKKIKVAEFASIVGMASIYILLRVTVLKSILSHVTFTTTLFQRLPGFFVAITDYIRLLFLPFNLHMEYGGELFHWTNPKAIGGVILLSTSIIYAFRKRRDNPLVFFAISWFIITLLPVSNLYPINAYMAEHWLYLPSVGFFLIVAKAMHSFYSQNDLKAITIIFIISLLGFCSYLTIKQNSYWREPISIYEQTLKYVPDSPNVLNNLGYEYNGLNRREEAISSYKSALKIKPDHVRALHNLGIAYQALNRYEEAIDSYKRALEIKPDYVNVYINLGNAYKATHKNAEAISSYKKALDIKPNYAEVYNNLGNAYSVANRNKEAITAFEKAIEIKPDYAQAYNNLGNVYNTIHNTDGAIALYKRAIEIDPHYYVVYNNLAAIYFNNKQYKLAIEYFDKAKALGFTNPALQEALTPYR